MKLERIVPNPADGSIAVLVSLDRDWRAWLRFRGTVGYPLAEMRVFPRERGQVLPPGEVRRRDAQVLAEEGQWSGDDSAVAPRGLSVRKVRDGLGDLDAIRDHLRRWAERTPAGPVFEPFRERLGPDLAQLSTVERLAFMARDYARLHDEGVTSVNVELGRIYGRTPEQVAQDVHKARRKYGLLTSTEPGVAGGKPTAKCRRIVKRLTEEDGS